MADATLRAHTDTWIEEDAPNHNHGSGVKLRIRGPGSGLERRVLVYMRPPFRRGATISSAILYLSARAGWGAGIRQITARRVEESWKENRVTWANQPSHTGVNAASVNVTNLADEEEIALDVTDQLQDVSDGDPFHGWKIFMDTDEARSFYSSDSPRDGVRPRLAISWSGAPYPPSNLHPSSGDAISVPSPRLTWRFTDKRGETDQGWSQVQISASSSFAGPLEYDSGKVANSRHSWPLAGEYVVPEGVDRWWRVKVWDTANLESGWSNGVKFRRVAKPDLTITNPPPAPANIVDETTPPIAWTFPGQVAIAVKLLEVFPSGRTRELWEWSRQKTDKTSITLPRGIVKTGKTLRVQVFGWDDVDREGIPGDHAWAFAQRDFTYERDGTPDPVETLTATLFGPAVTLEWTRTLEPDHFCLTVDGAEVLDRIDPDDVRTETPGLYRLTYWRAPPRTAHTYEVEAVVTVGGKKVHSAGNDFATKTTDFIGIWLVDEDANQAVFIEDAEDADLSIGESGTTFALVGRRRKVRVTDAIYGYEGSFSGGVKGEAARDTFLDLKGRPFAALRVIAANLNIPIVLEEVSASPTPSAAEPDKYRVGFAFFQDGEFFDIDGDSES